MTAPRDREPRPARPLETGWPQEPERRLIGIVLPSFEDPEDPEVAHGTGGTGGTSSTGGTIGTGGTTDRPGGFDDLVDRDPAGPPVRVVPSGPPPAWPPPAPPTAPAPPTTAVVDLPPADLPGSGHPAPLEDFESPPARREFPRYIAGELVLPTESATTTAVAPAPPEPAGFDPLTAPRSALAASLAPDWASVNLLPGAMPAWDLPPIEPEPMEPQHFDAQHFGTPPFETRSFETRSFETQTLETQPFETQNFEARSLKAQPAEPETARPEPIHPELIDPAPIESESAESKAAESEAAESEAAESEAATSETAARDAVKPWQPTPYADLPPAPVIAASPPPEAPVTAPPAGGGRPVPAPAVPQVDADAVEDPPPPRRTPARGAVPHPAFPDATARTFRILPIAADLLPLEIAETRHVRKVRRMMISGVVLVAALVLAWYGTAAYETRQAERELDSVQQTIDDLARQKMKYRDLQDTRRESQRITLQLRAVLDRDLSWSTLITALQQAAPAGVRISGVTGALNQETAVGAATGNGVGTITLTGTAPSKDTVASYVDTLATVTGIANPFPTDATLQDNLVSFTIRMDITKAALGGRYTTSSAAPSASPTGSK